jgi:hypothetical protein
VTNLTRRQEGCIGEGEIRGGEIGEGKIDREKEGIILLFSQTLRNINIHSILQLHC